MTLTEFLLARIAEDEASAHRVGPTRYYVHEFPRRGTAQTPEGEVLQEVTDRSPDRAGALFDHNARHQPGRVLAECEAKRRIILQHEESARSAENAEREGYTGTWAEAMAYAGDLAMRDLATVYADHPDYRDEWKP